MGIRFNHTMVDAQGFGQFLNAIAELACGASAPSLPPVWARDLLEAPIGLRPNHTHHEYEQMEDIKGTIIPLDSMVHRSFFFGPSEILALRRRLPPHLRSSSIFEILTACLWKCRTTAIVTNPNEEVRMIFPVNVRRKALGLNLPVGYYGNAFLLVAAISNTNKIIQNPLDYALELIKKTKSKVNLDYIHSTTALLVLRGRPRINFIRSYMVSDNRQAGYEGIDFGWGRPVYGGTAVVGVGFTSFLIPTKNERGEEGVIMPISLPMAAMERFVEEMEGMVKEPEVGEGKSGNGGARLIKSAL